ncbi:MULTISPECIES: hypothetical protein [unclassified Clostridium]|nr:MULTISPECIES: hypothetical protein [unclassified Clostridium]
MKTPKNVKINGVSQISALKSNTQSGFSLETDLHFLSDNIIKNGSSSESYPDFEDEPQAGTMPEPEPPKEEKKGFNWGKLACNVLAGLAVVAAVTAAVASQAISDVQRGEVSDMSSYMAAGGREAFIGALSGAIFGPFGASETVCAKMAVGGVTNAFESIIRQKLNGEDINWDTVKEDAEIGILTAGAFHYGGKAVKEAAPFVKKAANKVSSKISEDISIAKLAMKNLEKQPKRVVLGSNLGNVDEAARRIAKEFKKVKNEITPNKSIVKKATEGVSNPNYSSFRDLMSPDEVARYDKHWTDVAENISDEALDNQINFIKNGGITKPGGGAYKPAKVSSAVDMNTGDIYFGYNGANKFNPSRNGLRPELQELVDNTKTLASSEVNNPYASRESYELWSVDNCAEVYATNNALRGGANIDNIFLNTKYFNTGEYAEPCANCKITFKGLSMPNK